MLYYFICKITHVKNPPAGCFLLGLLRKVNAIDKVTLVYVYIHFKGWRWGRQEKPWIWIPSWPFKVIFDDSSREVWGICGTSFNWINIILVAFIFFSMDELSDKYRRKNMIIRTSFHYLKNTKCVQTNSSSRRCSFPSLLKLTETGNWDSGIDHCTFTPYPYVFPCLWRRG